MASHNAIDRSLARSGERKKTKANRDVDRISSKHTLSTDSPVSHRALRYPSNASMTANRSTKSAPLSPFTAPQDEEDDLGSHQSWVVVPRHQAHAASEERQHGRASQDRDRITKVPRQLDPRLQEGSTTDEHQAVQDEDGTKSIRSRSHLDYDMSWTDVESTTEGCQCPSVTLTCIGAQFEGQG